MSLDVYLEIPSHACATCNHEHGGESLYSANITHNLNTMADAAGLYNALWRPYLVIAPPEIAKEIGDLEQRKQWSDAKALIAKVPTVKARDLIEPIRAGLAQLRADPQRFHAFNPANGWGDYDGLVRFAANYLTACEEHPEATVRACR